MCSTYGYSYGKKVLAFPRYKKSTSNVTEKIPLIRFPKDKLLNLLYE